MMLMKKMKKTTSISSLGLCRRIDSKVVVVLISEMEGNLGPEALDLKSSYGVCVLMRLTNSCIS